MPVRGVATSGWRGRSQSLGIADSVTVLARTAAQADAAATIVANAVERGVRPLGHIPRQLTWQQMLRVRPAAVPVRRASHEGGLPSAQRCLGA